jgi:lipoate-protein ligase A
MVRAICRLLPYALADGPHNMAADEVLLESAAAGVASLRFYGWSEATLSLGYFQSEHVRQADEGLVRLPYVRRPTGGATLVHHYEVTYALGLPAGTPWHTAQSWLQRMHGIIGCALQDLGVATRMHLPGEETSHAGALCFRHFTPGDLLIGAAKVVGSAQRRQRGALVQHGAILLAGSPYTPALPGIQELCKRMLCVEEIAAAIKREIARQTGWDLAGGDWRALERERIARLVAERYTRDRWNRKR